MESTVQLYRGQYNSVVGSSKRDNTVRNTSANPSALSLYFLLAAGDGTPTTVAVLFGRAFSFDVPDS